MSTVAKKPVEIAEEPGDEGQRMLDEADEEARQELADMLAESLEDVRAGRVVSNEEVFRHMEQAEREALASR
jgi:predicted transcriptional regulator